MYTKLIGAGIIALALFGALAYVSHLKNTIEDLEGELSTAVAQGNVLSQKIIDQNASIDAAKAEADRRIAEAKIAIDAAKAETVKAQKRAISIYKAPPSVPNDLCKSAIDLINGAQK